MNQQDLNFVRIELRLALPDFSGGTKGQLEAFSEHPPADKNAIPRRGVGQCPRLVDTSRPGCGTVTVLTLAISTR